MNKLFFIIIVFLLYSKSSIANQDDTIHAKIKVVFIDSLDNSQDSHIYSTKYLILGLIQDGSKIECMSKVVFQASFTIKEDFFVGSIYNVVLERSKVESDDEKSEMEKKLENLPTRYDCHRLVLKESTKYYYYLKKYRRVSPKHK